MTIYVVTGPRHPSDDLAEIARRFVYEELVPGEDELVDGEAIGIDTICGTAAEERGITRHKFGIERVYGKGAWEKYGKGVGHMRNALMVDEHPICRVVGFWNGYSRGTFGCLEYAEKRKAMWRVYFDNGYIWSWPQGDSFLPEDSWAWRSYGTFMATKMYRASRMTRALEKVIDRVEMQFEGKDADKLQSWVNAAREGYNMLMDGVRPVRDHAAMIFPSKSKKGQGHEVYARNCNCKAGEFHQPCWARAAAEILTMLEAPPEFDPLT